MKRALLLVDHGSRAAEANTVVEAAAAAVRAARPDWIVEFAHMEILEPDIAAGIEACVRAGATDVVVQPWFLGPGRHVGEDIPAAVRAASANHPAVRFRVGEAFGADPALVDLVLARVDAEDA